jgi:hypothetical protein
MPQESVDVQALCLSACPSQAKGPPLWVPIFAELLTTKHESRPPHVPLYACSLSPTEHNFGRRCTQERAFVGWKSSKSASSVDSTIWCRAYFERSGVLDDAGETLFNFFRLWTGMYSSEFDEEYEDNGKGDGSRLVSWMSKDADLDMVCGIACGAVRSKAKYESPEFKVRPARHNGGWIGACRGNVLALWEWSTPYISASSTDQQKIIVVHIDSSHNGNHWS